MLIRYSIDLPADSPHQDYLHAPTSNILKPKDLQLVFMPHTAADAEMIDLQ